MTTISHEGIRITSKSTDLPRLSFTEEVPTPLAFDENNEPIFCINKVHTTQSFDKKTSKWINQSVTVIPDPIGVFGETMIGQRRTERPKSEAHPPPSAKMEQDTVQALFPILAHPDNEWLLSALVEGIDKPNILGWIFQQLDSMNDKRKVENLKKIILLNPSVPEEILFDTCIFCNTKMTQISTTLGRPGSAVSIHNDYPFAPLLHKVMILQERKHDIAQITSHEIHSFYELLYKIVNEAKKDLGDQLDGVTYGMNYGLPRIHKGRNVIASGASQPHLHSQIAALTKNSYNLGDRLALICEAYATKNNNRDYLADYLTALKRANLILSEDDNAVLYVPIAQRFNYELQIMVKDPRVGNILEANSSILKSIGDLEYLAYMMYQHPEINVQSFNTVMHATRFSLEKRYNQRLIVSIYPRTTIIALSELANRYVVDSFPWVTANILMEAQEQILTKGPRHLKILVIAAHPDDMELGCGGSLSELKKRNHEIHALVVTDGCGGADRSPEVREKEANEAARIIGVNTISFGRIRDGQAHQGDTLFNLIFEQFKRHTPDIVMVHASISSEHSDHKNVSEAVKSVCARQHPRLYPLQFEVPAYPVDSSFMPNIFINIDGSIDIKKKAVEQHKSEVARGTINSSQIEDRATTRAIEVSPDVRFAEAFFVDAPDKEILHLRRLMPFIIP